MSSENNPSQGVQDAKQKALNNTVWLPVKMRAKRQQHDMANIQCDKASSQQDNASSQPDKTSSQRKKASSQHEKVRSQQDEAKAEKKHKRPQLHTKKSSGCHTHTTHQLTESIKEGRSEEQSESEVDDDSDRTNFDGTDSSLSDFKDPKSIVKSLSTGIPGFISSTKAKNQAVNKQSARTHKRASETPVWADDSMASESEESHDESAPKSDPDTSTFVKSEQDLSDAERIGSESSLHHSGSSSAKLVLTNTGKVKMTDQDITTQKVIQGGILEVKAYMTFVNGYPELIEKTSFSCDALLKSAHDCSATSIEMEIKNNDAYTSALASLGS
ncbi:hypothetical protein EDB19DRAFT_1917919 [Suillus lakei]|nr:hypothetical protein EDB19DRAFT_1917919 [Suillus lakei]